MRPDTIYEVDCHNNIPYYFDIGMKRKFLSIKISCPQQSDAALASSRSAIDEQLMSSLDANNYVCRPILTRILRGSDISTKSRDKALIVSNRHFGQEIGFNRECPSGP